MTRAVRCAVAFLWVAVAGCGDSSGLERFPNLTGTYVYNATINGVSLAALNGTLSVTLSDRETGTLAGSYSIVLSGGGTAPLTISGNVTGSISEDRQNVFFELQQSGTQYPHSGHIAGATIAGTYSLIFPGSASYNGNFTAIRR